RIAGFLTRRPVVSTIHNGRVDLDSDPLHLQLLERWSARLWCRRLIVVSDLLREEIAEWFGVPLRRVHTITNGVDITRFSAPPGLDRAALKRELLGGDYRMVTNVARLVPQKGQSCLVEAAARVLVARPDVRFVMVGDGPLRGELVQMGSDLGISDRLVITGLRSDIAAILAASDVFVLSSIWEGMPLSLLEAMSVGCPAVATDVGGVGEVLQDNVTGLIVPAGDSAALAEAICQCLDHPESAGRRAAAAQKLVARKYSMSAMIRKWENVYVQEVRGPRRR
ncbi:MAG: glycosyltransferase family 4 protein, partial [Chloroflexota bacterium]|nr:glycosyltransferase family 4 protein [Chloroflexota bacterium]